MTSNTLYVNLHSGGQNSSTQLTVPRIDGMMLFSCPGSSAGMEWRFPPAPIVQVTIPAFEAPKPVEPARTIPVSETSKMLTFANVQAKLVSNGSVRTLQVPTFSTSPTTASLSWPVLDAADRPTSNCFGIVSLNAHEEKCCGLCGVMTTGDITLWPSLAKNDDAWSTMIGANVGVDGFALTWLV